MSLRRFRICACTDTSRALVGSSRSRNSGSGARARAIAIRWRWPPENSCGKRYRCSGRRPTSCSRRALCSYASGRVARPLTRSGSATMSLTSRRGSSEVNGSWKTGCMKRRSAFIDLRRSRVIEYWRSRSFVWPSSGTASRACVRRRSKTSRGTLKRTRPSLGASGRSRSRPNVVLPQPDSPTSATVSPRRITRSTPSTARTVAISRWRSPPFTGKCFFRPRAASRISFRSRLGRATRHLLRVEMAGDSPIRPVGEELRLLDPAPIEGERTSRMEAAARRRRQQIRDDSWNRGERGARFELLTLRRNDRLEETLRVRMKRVGEEIGHRSVLDDFPGVHDGDPVAEFRDDRKVVRDVEDCGIDSFPEVFEKPKDLRLRRHVERRRRFVGDHQGRLPRQRHGDHHPLLHPPAELVRVRVVDLRRLRNPDASEELDHVSSRLLLDWPVQDRADHGYRGDDSIEQPSGPKLGLGPEQVRRRLPEPELDRVLLERDRFHNGEDCAERPGGALLKEDLDAGPKVLGRHEELPLPPVAPRTACRSKVKTKGIRARRNGRERRQALCSRVLRRIQQIDRWLTQGESRQSFPLTCIVGLLHRIEALQESEPPADPLTASTRESLDPSNPFIDRQTRRIDQGVDLVRSQPGPDAEVGDQALSLRRISGSDRLAEQVEILLGQILARKQAVANLLSALEHQHLGDLISDPENGVQGGHRLLEDHRHASSSDPVHPGSVLLQQWVRRQKLRLAFRPWHDADVVLAPGEEVEASEPDFTASDSPRRLLNQVHDRKRCDRLATARLADEPDHLTRSNLEVDLVHRPENPAPGRELRLQTSDDQDRLHALPPRTGIEDVAEAVPEEVDPDREDKQGNPWDQDRPGVLPETDRPSDVDQVA